MTGHSDWDDLVVMMEDHYSYQLPEEKKYHVVIRGLCEGIDAKRTKEELGTYLRNSSITLTII